MEMNVYMALVDCPNLEAKGETERIHRAGCLLPSYSGGYVDLLNDENSLSISYLSINRLALTVYQIILACRTVTVFQFQSLAIDHLQTPLNPVNPVTPVKVILLTVTTNDSTCRTSSIEMTKYDQKQLC